MSIYEVVMFNSGIAKAVVVTSSSINDAPYAYGVIPNDIISIKLIGSTEKEDYSN